MKQFNIFLDRVLKEHSNCPFVETGNNLPVHVVPDNLSPTKVVVDFGQGDIFLFGAIILSTLHGELSKSLRSNVHVVVGLVCGLESFLELFGNPVQGFLARDPRVIFVVLEIEINFSITLHQAARHTERSKNSRENKGDDGELHGEQKKEEIGGTRR
jgi:hypothetical protein